MIENLAHQILTTLRKESEGGTLHNVSSGIFLQLMEMEQKTCTIRLENKQNGRKGVLFFSNGELFDARVNDNHGKTAAFEIFAWDEVNLTIQNGCALKKNLIRHDIQTLMLESMRRKDEYKDAQRESGATDPEVTRARQQEQAGRDLRDRIEFAIGPRCEAEYIQVGDNWEKRIDRFKKAGQIFGLGNLLAGFIDSGEQKDYVLVPGVQTTVLKVDPKCPRDKIIQILTE